MACAPRAHGRPFRLWGRRRGRTIEIINERIVERDVAGDAANTKRLMKPAQRTRDPSMSLGQFPFVGRFQGKLGLDHLELAFHRTCAGESGIPACGSPCLPDPERRECSNASGCRRSRFPCARLFLIQQQAKRTACVGCTPSMKRIFPLSCRDVLNFSYHTIHAFLRLAVGLVGNADSFVSYDVLMCSGSGPPSIGSERLCRSVNEMPVPIS